MSDMTGRTIVVGVDGSIRSVEAARWAAREAVRHEAGLELVHASYLSYALEDDRTGEDGALLEAFSAASTEAPGLSIETLSKVDQPVHYLLQRSHDAAMIVLGTHPGNSISGAVFGSVAQAVAAHAVCPVVIIGGGKQIRTPDSGAVVVGVSPHPGGLEAMQFAFAEAELRGCDVIALRSWGDVDWSAGRLGYNSELFTEWRRMEMNVLNECLAPVEEKFPAVTVHRQLKGTRPTLALEQSARGARLLVVGAHRSDDHWFSRLGPVPSWLLHRSPCPLVVVGQPHQQPAELAETDAQTDARADSRDAVTT